MKNRAESVKEIMVWLGRIVGGILGFAVGVFFTEVVFPNTRETEPLIAVTLLTIAGIVLDSWLARRFANRSVKLS